VPPVEDSNGRHCHRRDGVFDMNILIIYLLFADINFTAWWIVSFNLDPDLEDSRRLVRCILMAILSPLIDVFLLCCLICFTISEIRSFYRSR
jgi:hypothetical protein